MVTECGRRALSRNLGIETRPGLSFSSTCV
jgi:hypothetical protein